MIYHGCFDQVGGTRVPLEEADLHVVVAATLMFDESLLETVIQKNTNPLAAAERGTLILASAVLGEDAATLVSPEVAERLSSGKDDTLFVTGSEQN
jgi:hypothetical protein